MSNVVEFAIRAQDEFSAALGKLNTGLTKTEAAFAAVGVTAALYAGLKLAQASLDNAEAMGVAASKANMTTESYSALAWAAKMSNVEAGTLAAGMRGLNKAMAEGETSSAGQALERLGVASHGANGELRDSVDVLYDVADAFAGSRDDANKTKVAMEVFGKAGKDMVPMLNQGSESIRAMMDDAKKLGMVIGDDFAKSADQINDNMATMAAVIGGSVNVAMAELAPTIELVTGEIVQFLTEGDNVKEAGEAIAATFKVLFSAGSLVAGVFRQLGMIIGATATAIMQSVDGDFSGAIDTMKSLGSDLEEDSKKTMANIKGYWDGSAQSAAAASAKTASDARKLKESLDVATKASEDARKEAEKLAKAVTDAGDAMLSQIMTTGMSTASTKAYELQQKGAEGAEMARVNSLAALINAQESFKTSFGEATSIIEGQQSPLEKHIELVEKINQLKADGAMTADQQTEALKRENEAWDSAILKTKEYKESTVDVFTGVSAMLNDHITQLGSVSFQVNSLIADSTMAVVKGVGDSVAASIVEGKNLEESLNNVAKSVMKTVISTLIQIGVQRMILAVIGRSAAAAEGSAQMGSALGQVYLNSFASAAAIPFYGWALAPGVAAANTATAAALTPAAIATGAALGAGAAHGGLTDVPAEATYLLDKGERVLSPRQNSDLTSFLDSNQGNGGSVVIQNLTIHVLENATSADVFTRMDKVDLRNNLGQPVIDALNEMFSAGVRPNFATQGV